MANLQVTIIIRSTRPTGKRTGSRPTASPASGYLLPAHCQGSTPRYIKAGKFYAEAEMAQKRLEWKLKAASQGFVVPEEATDPKKALRIPDVITAYLVDLRLSRRIHQ